MGFNAQLVLVAEFIIRSRIPLEKFPDLNPNTSFFLRKYWKFLSTYRLFYCKCGIVRI